MKPEQASRRNWSGARGNALAGDAHQPLESDRVRHVEDEVGVERPFAIAGGWPRPALGELIEAEFRARAARRPGGSTGATK